MEGTTTYTDAQRLTIALAELASALGKQLDPQRKDWWNVQALTAHVREQRGVEWLTVGGLPGTPQGDMAIIGFELRYRAVQGDVVAAFNRTLERVERGARNEAYQLNQAAREKSREHNEATRTRDAAPPPTGEAFLELVGRVAALESKAGA